MSTASPTPVELVRAVSLTEQIAANIRTRILKGELRPGERLVEQQLAKALGVGQNAVREALFDLAHRGFVRRVVNRGTYVTSLTFEEASKLAEVRGALEALAIDLVRRRANSESIDWAPLEKLLEAMRHAAHAGDREAFYRADLSWHHELWRLADNEHLYQSLEQVVVPLFAFFIMLYMRRDNATESFLEAVDAHQKVVDGLKTTGGDAAAGAMRELVDLALKHQQGLIAQQE